MSSTISIGWESYEMNSELACVIDDSCHAVTPPLIEIRYYLGYMLASGAPLQVVERVFDDLRSIYYMRRDYAVVGRTVAQRLDYSRSEVFRPIENPEFRLKSIDLENCLADIAVSMQAPAHPFRRADINAEWLDGGMRLGN